jgi:hypothetical protein
LRISRIAVLLLLFAALAWTFPDVHAQTTSITELHHPLGALAGSMDPISVTATVSYRDAGPSYVLVVGILDMGLIPSRITPGLVTSSPDQCANQAILAAFCAVKTTGSSGVEHLEFKIGGILGDRRAEGNWNLNMTAALATSNNTLVQNSTSSILFTVTIASMILTVRVPATVAVSVDGVKQVPGSVQIPVAAGPHNITVPVIAQVDNTTRLRFDSWADGFSEPNRTVNLNLSRSFEAVYATQYRLSIAGQAASATGQRWYDAGSIATFSVSDTEPMSGILGLLGGKLRFQGWYEGNKFLTDEPIDMIVMDKPHTLTVRWQADYTMPFAVIATIAIVLSLAYFVVRRRTGTPSAKSQMSSRN